MELVDLIEVRKQARPNDDPVLGALIEIQKLDSRRDDNLYRLAEKVSQLERRFGGSTLRADADLRDWLRGYRHSLDAALSDRRELFGAALAEGLEPGGLKLRGQYPKLYAGLFTFDLNFDKGRCRIWYGPEQEMVTEMTLEAGKVAEVVRSARSKLGSGLEPPALLTRILQAFRHARLDRGDAPMPLLALLPYMALLVQTDRFYGDPRKESYREYSRADFSYDLYRVREVGSKLRLTTATRQQTLRRSDFLWIPSREDVEDGHYVATIDVKEEQP